MKNFFKGAATALVTPFDGREVNYAVLEKLIARQIKAGIGAVAVLGTTGEAATVTKKERREIFAFCVRIRNKYDETRRTKLIFGCGANDTREAVKNTEIAAKLGADGVLCITPYCNKCTQRGLYEYYREICQATALPVIAYNVPSRTGVNIQPETMEAIAELKNIAGIKDAGGNMAQTLETLRRIRRQCDFVFRCGRIESARSAMRRRGRNFRYGKRGAKHRTGALRSRNRGRYRARDTNK